MRTTGDTHIYDNYTDNHYDLIFTPAEQVVTETNDTDYTPIVRIDENKIVKKGCDGNCECKECDDISGDNVEW
jgi:hypothetical protein